MISWFARNSVAANLLMVTIIIGGVLALNDGIKLEIFPFSDPDTVTVSVPLRGATPEDVELGVAVRIEEAVQDLEGIDNAYGSRSMPTTIRASCLTISRAGLTQSTSSPLTPRSLLSA
jgi:multidrug efflux pump subunit AcrB